MSYVAKIVRDRAKSIAFRYTKLGAPHFPYHVEPIQLATLINELERVRPLPGNIAEIGVARGMTTRFICQHFSTQQTSPPILYAIDTFSSFQRSDLDFEVNERGKSRWEMNEFGYNNFEAWSRNFANCPYVKPVQADCSTFDYESIAPLKLTFLDVDLYLPTKGALPRIYDVTLSGGVILIDDVMDNNRWDGAYQAYMEFCGTRGIAPKVIGNKCGIIYKS
jgi:Macrocin-O-methyltransferase (TylF)